MLAEVNNNADIQVYHCQRGPTAERVNTIRALFQKGRPNPSTILQESFCLFIFGTPECGVTDSFLWSSLAMYSFTYFLSAFIPALAGFAAAAPFCSDIINTAEGGPPNGPVFIGHLTDERRREGGQGLIT
jgi:hypothetical protein